MTSPLLQFSRASRWLTEQAGGAKHLRSVGRLITLAALVGVVAGLGAILFHAMTQFVGHVALDGLVGYHQGSPRNESELFKPSSREFTPWLLLIVPTIGGLVSGWLVYRFAPEAEGHGTDSAIDAYHNKRGVIRGRVPIVKMITSAITLGTGGSGGREGPIAQIGAGFGSYLGTRLGLSDADRRILLVAGLGAGIGAIFHAPLAGAIFAIEVLYRDADFEAEALIPAFIATTVAYCVFNLAIAMLGSVEGFDVDGFSHLFAVPQDMRFRNPILLAPLTVLALAMVAASALYVRTFYTVNRMFRSMAIRRPFKPMVGAFATGLLALLLYYGVAGLGLGGEARHGVLSVLGHGYGLLQKALASADGSGLVVGVLLVVAFGKMLTTSLTIGSGGSGGVFGPSMVIGGALGAVIGLAFERVMPGVVTHVPVFVILGMAGFFAAAAKTPVSTLIMVSEMTGSYELLLPSMWVCAIAYLLSRNWTIYKEQVNTRRESAAHRGDFLLDVVQGLSVRDALDAAGRSFISVPLDMALREVVRLIAGTRQSAFPVLDGEKRYVGLVGLTDLRQFLYDAEVGEIAVAHDLAVTDDQTEPLTLDTDLGSAIGRFAGSRFEELPVVDAESPRHVVGMLRRHDVLSTYHRRLMDMRSGAGPASAGARR